MTKAIADALAASLNAAGITPYHKDSAYDGSSEPEVDGHVFGCGSIVIPGSIALVANDMKARAAAFEDGGYGVEWLRASDTWATFEKHAYGWC